MRKVGIVLIICLLAVAGITAAMAYNTAKVTNPGEFSIVSTNEALLGFEIDFQNSYANISNNEVVTIDNGVMGFNFAKGASEHGFQPNSEYNFNRVFNMVNNTNNQIIVWYKLTEDLQDAYDKGWLRIGASLPGVAKGAAEFHWRPFGEAVVTGSNFSADYQHLVLPADSNNYVVSFYFQIPEDVDPESYTAALEGDMEIYGSLDNPTTTQPFQPWGPNYN